MVKHLHLHTDTINALKLIGNTVYSVSKNQKMIIWDIFVSDPLSNGINFEENRFLAKAQRDLQIY